jgi:hypothetical protein
MKDINIFIQPLGPWPRHCLPHASTQDPRYVICHANTCVKASYARKGFGLWPITRCKHIKSPDVPYLMTTTQPRLMKCIATILLALGPTWDLHRRRGWRCHATTSTRAPEGFLWYPHLHSGSPTRFQIEQASPRAFPSAAQRFLAWPQTSTHKVCHAMYSPTLYLDCSLGAGEAADAVSLTLQEFF